MKNFWSYSTLTSNKISRVPIVGPNVTINSMVDGLGQCAILQENEIIEDKDEWELEDVPERHIKKVKTGNNKGETISNESQRRF